MGVRAAKRDVVWSARDHRLVEVEIARDWLDYVQAAGVLVSLLLAAGALVYAKKSSDAASESAHAAETTAAAATQEANQTRELLRLATDQHERLVSESRRRPLFAPPALAFRTTLDPSELTLGQIASMGRSWDDLGRHAELWPAVFSVSFENVGSKAADRALARVAVPVGVGLWRSGPRGEHPENVDLQPVETLTLRTPTGDSAVHAHAWRIPDLPPRQGETLHVLLVFPRLGDYEAELQAQHEDADPAAQRFLISVPRAGAVHVETM